MWIWKQYKAGSSRAPIPHAPSDSTETSCFSSTTLPYSFPSHPLSSSLNFTAHQLRHLLLNEIPKRSNSFPKEHSPAPNAAASPFQPKPELERSHALLAKHNSPAPVIVCRKRSSISAKPNSSATTFSQKEKQGSDEKTPALDANSPPIKPSSDNSTLKTKAKEKPVTGVRSLRRSNKNPTNNNTMQ